MSEEKKLVSQRRRGFLSVSLALLTGGFSAGCLDSKDESIDERDDSGNNATNIDGNESVYIKASLHPELGEILIDRAGRTLYIYEEDENKSSKCYNQCISNWPPLTVDGEEGLSSSDVVNAELDVFDRRDGSKQVSVNGKPLYLYSDDEEKDDVFGQGVNDSWWVVRPNGSPVRE